MEEDKIQTTKKPWPGRLVNSSRLCIKWWLFVLATTLLLTLIFSLIRNTHFIAPTVIIAGLLICAVLFVGSFLLSLVALLGMPFYGFKNCSVGRALKILIFTYVVFSLGFAITGPALMQAKSTAHEIKCGSNLKTLSLACLAYHAANDKQWVLNDWGDVLKPYYDDKGILKCYIDKTGPCSYAMNENIPADANELPGDLVLLFESAPGWNQVGGPDDVVTDRHGKPGANIAFADGHVEFVKSEDIPTLRWTPEQ